MRCDQQAATRRGRSHTAITVTTHLHLVGRNHLYHCVVIGPDTESEWDACLRVSPVLITSTDSERACNARATCQPFRFDHGRRSEPHRERC